MKRTIYRALSAPYITYKKRYMTFREQNAIIEDIKISKESGDTKKTFDYCVELLLPEAETLKELAEKNLTTKDGYGTILQFVSNMKGKEPQRIMLKALERVGYPNDTLQNVREILAI